MLGKQSILSFLVVLSQLIHASPASAQDDVAYRLDPSVVRCAQENRGLYDGISGFPGIVPLVDCPDLPENPLSSLLRNEGPNVSIDPELQFDPFVYLLRKEELTCLLDTEIKDGSVAVVFRPRECEIEFVEK
jgi:hypothetical protein